MANTNMTTAQMLSTLNHKQGAQLTLWVRDWQEELSKMSKQAQQDAIRAAIALAKSRGLQRRA